MSLYYRGPDVLITHEAFTLRAPHRQSFPLAELHDVHIVRAARRSGPAMSAPGACAVAVVVAVILAVVGWLALDTVLAPLVILPIVAVPTAIAARGGGGADHTLELRATVRRQLVALYVSSDPVRFGQVSRALARALRDRQEGRNLSRPAGSVNSAM